MDAVKCDLTDLSQGAEDAVSKAGEEKDTSDSGAGAEAAGAGAALTVGAGAGAAGAAAASSASDSIPGTQPSTKVASTDDTVTDSAEQTPSNTAKEGTMADTEQKHEETEDGHRGDEPQPSDVTSKENQEQSTGGGEEKKVGGKEREDAIPTAGGERIGAKHWGESKVVPDLPPKRESAAGQVSSGEGQPDSMMSLTDQV